MKRKPRLTCAACGHEYSGAMEFFVRYAYFARGSLARLRPASQLLKKRSSLQQCAGQKI